MSIRWCGGVVVLWLFSVVVATNLGGVSFSELRRFVFPLMHFSSLGGGVINPIPTFSPLINTSKKQNFVTLTLCYSLQTPIFFLWSSNNSFPKGFVNISAKWFSDLQNSMLISLLFINFHIKWYLVSICLLLLWKTWFLDSAIVDLLSHKIWVGSLCSCSNSKRVLLNPYNAFLNL